MPHSSMTITWLEACAPALQQALLSATTSDLCCSDGLLSRADAMSCSAVKPLPESVSGAGPTGMFSYFLGWVLLLRVAPYSSL